MNRRLLATGLGVLAGSVLVGTWVGILGGAEPSYRGKSLTFWLDECNKSFNGVTKELGPGAGPEAVRQIGTNALPFLLEMAKVTGPDYKWRLRKALGEHLHVRDQADSKAHARAWVGFAALGPVAKPAVASLVGMLDDRTSTIRNSAAISLGYIGPAASDAVPRLIRHAEDPNSEVRSSCAWALRRIQEHPQQRRQEARQSHDEIP